MTRRARLLLERALIESRTDTITYELEAELERAAVFQQRAPAEPLPQCRVYVDVLSARDLEEHDFSGTSSAFAVVKFGAEKAHTQVVKNSLEPVWDAHFEFQAARADLPESLRIRHV